MPDPDIIPNVGSFFHNPILSNIEITKLKLSYDSLPVFVVDNEHSKISAGWLIDNLGLKGYRENNIGVYEKQALVLVNYGHTNQTEILNFAKNIQNKVKIKYGVELNIEPIII